MKTNHLFLDEVVRSCRLTANSTEGDTVSPQHKDLFRVGGMAEFLLSKISFLTFGETSPEESFESVIIASNEPNIVLIKLN